MKSGKGSVLETQGTPREPSRHALVPGPEGGRQRLEGWRLPSGAALAEFALQSGFLAARLWEENRRADSQATFAGSPAERHSEVR